MMSRHLSLITLILLITVATNAQKVADPVRWVFSKNRVGVNEYELHLKAVITKGWHIYSQTQPDNSVSVPASFKFKQDRDYILIGRVSEDGRLIKFEDSTSGLGAYEFAEEVDFTQKVKISGKSFSPFLGTITFQACTDSICLPPRNVEFRIL